MDLDTLARRQHGVLTQAQALAGGMTQEQLEWRVASGRWRRLSRGVYQVNPMPPSWLARASGLTLRLGPGVALMGQSAAYLHGLRPTAPGVIAVAVPPSRHPVRSTGSHLHRRGRILAVTRRGLPVTSAPQTVIDLTGASGVAWFEAVNLCGRAVQNRLCTADDLAAELAARGRHPHRHTLRQALGIVGDGAETAAEVQYIRRVERAHGLPSSQLQVIAGDDGFRIRRDVEYPEWGVVVEIDGSIHNDPQRRMADVGRDRRTAAEGKLTLRVLNDEVLWTPCTVALDVALTLRQRGWAEAARACTPRCPLRSLALAA